MDVILYVVNQLRKSGPVNVLKNIIDHLDRERFYPVIVKFMKDDTDRSITSQFLQMDVEVYEMNVSFWDLELRTFQIARRLELLLNKVSPSIIHAHGYHPVLVVSRLRNFYPKVNTLHCISWEDFIYSKGLFLGSYMNCRYLKSLFCMDYSVAISQTVQACYKGKLPQKDIRLIYNGINIKTGIKSQEKKELRMKLGFPEGQFLFLVVGALTKGKDPLTVIKAFKQAVRQLGPNRAKLILLGQGALKKKCLKIIKNDPSIELRGYVLNTSDYFEAADYSICASRSEGFGLNFIESLLAGTPVISSTIGVFNEFNSLYPSLRPLQFATGNVEELAKKIIYVTTHPVDIQSMLPDVERRFSAVGMSEAYMNLYSELIVNRIHKLP